MEGDLKSFFEEYVMSEIPAVDVMAAAKLLISGKEYSILDNDNVLIEVLKNLGVMEVSANKEEFMALVAKKKGKNKDKKEPTDFDKVLKGIMSVPKPKEREE
jgi:hypothetical protein